MSFFGRIKDILSTNINDLLDNAKDPEKLANEYLRQLNEQYYEAKTEVASAMADETRLQQRKVQYEAEVERWQGKAEQTLRAGKEDLAKQALQRKKHAERLAQQYTQRYEAYCEHVDKLQDALATLEMQIGETKACLDLIDFTVVKKHRMQTMQAIRGTSASMGVQSAMDEFAQMKKEQIVQLESSSLESEFQQLDEDSAVDAELEELKRSLGV